MEKFYFSGRQNSKKGILSFVIGILNLIIFLIISIFLSQSISTTNLWIGIYGLIALAISIFGFYIGYKSTFEKDIFFKFPILGIAFNSLLMVFLIILYLLGIFIG
ncbi:MAG TPA: hypothetical protein GXZ90_05565 [Clostridiales bacterium]|nr:hypothetical protein [Clostridiales bacterium]